MSAPIVFRCWIEGQPENATEQPCYEATVAAELHVMSTTDVCDALEEPTRVCVQAPDGPVEIYEVEAEVVFTTRKVPPPQAPGMAYTMRLFVPILAEALLARGHSMADEMAGAVFVKFGEIIKTKAPRLLALSPELRARAARGLVLLCEREARRAAQQGASS